MFCSPVINSIWLRYNGEELSIDYMQVKQLNHPELPAGTNSSNSKKELKKRLEIGSLLH